MAPPAPAPRCPHSPGGNSILANSTGFSTVTDQAIRRAQNILEEHSKRI